jgi:hypothetical protein
MHGSSRTAVVLAIVRKTIVDVNIDVSHLRTYVVCFIALAVDRCSRSSIAALTF